MIANNTNNSQNSTDSEEQSEESTIIDSQDSTAGSTNHETASLTRTYAIHPNYSLIENNSSAATMIAKHGAINNQATKPEEAKKTTIQRRATI